MEVTKPTAPTPIPVPVPVPSPTPSPVPVADDAITIDDAMKALYYVSWAFTIGAIVTFGAFSVLGLATAAVGMVLDKRKQHDFQYPFFLSVATMFAVFVIMIWEFSKLRIFFR